MTIAAKLIKLNSAGILRNIQAFENSGGVFIHEGRRIINFSSNDYLGLSSSEKVKSASISAIENFGCGATASRLMSGSLKLHQQLETKIAQTLLTESALVFGSGFLANIGVITALAGKDDIIFADKLNHASLVDGGRLSGAKVKRYKHKDVASLQKFLKDSHKETNKIIITDSVFSMDGDIAPLEDIYVLAKKFNAKLIIDEAHAVGIFGLPAGGVWQSLGINDTPEIILGTMSKALGSYGGFVGCSSDMKKYLINKARSFIYSTGLPPASVAAALKSLSIINDKGDMGISLLEKAKAFRKMLLESGLTIPETDSQILQIPVGNNEEAVSFSQKLLERGILATAIRPPTVPKGTARLRLSVSLAHKDNDLKISAEKISLTAKELRLL
jgi:8-amino-7-oxononanoate synthase